MKRIVIFLIITLLLVQCNYHVKETEGYIETNGVETYYKMIGSGGPIVILHGGPGMFHDYLIPHFYTLAENYQLIFYDQRGNGRSLMDSLNSKNFSLDLLVEDIEELRKKFKIDKINLLGHSWGGLLAMQYAVRYPENMKSLMLVAPAPVNLDFIIKSDVEKQKRYTESELSELEKIFGSEDFLRSNSDAFNKAIYISEGVNVGNLAMKDSVFKYLSFNETTARNSIVISELSADIWRNLKIESELSKIECPTLILKGKNDFVINEFAEYLQKLIKDSKLVLIDNCGHYPFAEQKQLFFKELEIFLSKI